MGRKKLPYFRVIAIDSRKQRDGAELDRLGVYNPLADDEVFNVDQEKLFHWLEQGAQPSDTVRNLMKDHGLALKWHLYSQGKSEEEIDREFQKWQLLRESKAAAKAEQERREAEEKEQEPEPADEEEIGAQEEAGQAEEQADVTVEEESPAAEDAEPDEKPTEESEESTDASEAEEESDADAGAETEDEEDKDSQ